jgi:hypothetical protein
MKFLCTLGALLAALSLHAAALNELSAEQKAAGWKLIFNGRDLGGWRPYGKPGAPGAGWKVEDGLLRKLPKVRGGDLITTNQFGDFEFAWEWRIAPGGNNGVKYFVTEQRPGAPGHEYQMIDDTGHPDGKLGPKRQTAAFYDVLPPAADKHSKPAGEWNSSRVVVKGQRVEHWLNGGKVLGYDLGSDELKKSLAASKFKNSPKFGEKISGHLMLTDHQDETWFRNLMVRELK